MCALLSGRYRLCAELRGGARRYGVFRHVRLRAGAPTCWSAPLPLSVTRTRPCRALGVIRVCGQCSPVRSVLTVKHKQRSSAGDDLEAAHLPMCQARAAFMRLHKWLKGCMVQARKYAFKCHRRSEGGRDTVFPVNAIAFAPFHGTFATGGAPCQSTAQTCRTSPEPTRALQARSLLACERAKCPRLLAAAPTLCKAL